MGAVACHPDPRHPNRLFDRPLTAGFLSVWWGFVVSVGGSEAPVGWSTWWTGSFPRGGSLPRGRSSFPAYRMRCHYLPCRGDRSDPVYQGHSESCIRGDPRFAVTMAQIPNLIIPRDEQSRFMGTCRATRLSIVDTWCWSRSLPDPQGTPATTTTARRHDRPVRRHSRHPTPDAPASARRNPALLAHHPLRHRRVNKPPK
jgi:hypothetical protein